MSEEAKANFLCIILASGYHHHPTKDKYRSITEDLDASIILKIMSGETFRSIED